jgi:ATP phosphoribosyltransferase regulatory subunit
MARLRAIDAGKALASRLDGLAQVAASVGGAAALTLDPTERHGFEYQSWLGFSIFAAGVRGEIGRGGTYAIVRDGAEEPAVGFSLYVDPIVDAGVGGGERRRLFVPLGSDPALAARLRAEGWVTVAALDESDTAQAQLCTHTLENGDAEPVA